MFKYMIVVGLLMVVAVTGCTTQVTSASGSAKTVQGSGIIGQEGRAVSGFHAVQLQGEGEIRVVFGDMEGVSIEADDNFLPLIGTHVENGTLIIDLDDREQPLNLQPTQPIRFTIAAKMLDGFEIMGNGTLVADDVKADRVTVTIHGCGDVRLTGEAREQFATITGAGNIDTQELHTAYTRAEIKGSGNISVWATDQLDAAVMAAGNIDYQGQPVVNQTISGLGTIGGR
ncbi:hypothetical protein GPROT1_01068 [Gammaproteobacteria bacterium]|nr:hypothetical protein GPROT1_01068 [Gammaproteobacteria bacterium]